MKTQTPTKTFLTTCAIATSLVAFAISSRADNFIGVDFGGRDGNSQPILIQSTDVAGAPGYQQKNWNEVNDAAVGENGTTGALNDRNGVATPVTLQFVANDSWNNDGPSGSPQEKFMNGIIKAGQVGGAAHTDNFTFHNVPAGAYTMVAYLDVNGDGVAVDVAAGGTTYSITENHQFRGYQQAHNTAGAGSRDNGNFVVFNRLTPDGNGNLAFTMTWPAVGGDGAGMAAVQLISSEPKVLTCVGAGLNNVRITYNQAVSDSAGNASSYSIAGLTVSGASLDASHTVVLLTTSAQTPRANYTVTINGVTGRDAFADPIVPNTTASFTGTPPYDVAVNFEGGYSGGPPPQALAPGDVAGVYPVGNWNNMEGNLNDTAYSDGVPMNDVDGKPSPVTLQFAADEQWISGTVSDGTSPRPPSANQKLLEGYFGFANGSQNVPNTDPAFANGDPANSDIRPVLIKNVPEGHYSVIAYTVRDESGRGEGFTINNDPSTTLHVRSENFQNWNSNPTFRRGVSTDPTARDLCNYVQFDNVQPVNGTITLDARSEGFRSPVNGIQLVYTDFLPIQIVANPVSTTTGPGGTFSFSADAIGSGPRVTQWFSNNVAIPGANTLTYTGTGALSLDGVKYHVTVSNGGSSATSADATLTVAPVPILLSAGSLDSLTQVCIRFSKPLSASSLDLSHYSISPAVAINSAAFAASDPNVVILQTAPLTDGATYTVTVTGVTDTLTPANTIFPNPSSTTFTAGGYEPVRLTYKQFRDIGGAQAVSQLTGSPKFPNNPDFIEYNGNNAVDHSATAVRRMEYPQTSTQPYGNLEGFGSQFYGVYIAPASGNYKFAIATDDNGQLFLSTDATPAHKVLIASVADWTDERNYITRSDGAGVNAVSASVTLVAGNQYYIEALQKEGGGGDHVEVAVQRPGDPAIVNGTVGIALDQFAPDPSGLQYYRAGKVTYLPGPVTLTAQPGDVSTVEGQTVTFSTDFTGTPPIAVQWYKNGTAISGATGKSLSFVAAAADNGAIIKAVVQSQCSGATTRDAALTVAVDTTPPTIADAGCDAADKVIRVVFSEPVLSGGGANAGDNVGNYSIDGGLSITAASLLSDNKTVILTASDVLTPNQLYTLGVQNVEDRSVTGNIMDPATAPVTGCICTNGVVMAEMFRGDSGPNNFNTMTNNPKFPNNPDNIYFLPTANWAQTPNGSWTAGNEENYALRMKGWIVPSVSGNYTFGVHADDSGALRLATDGNPGSLLSGNEFHGTGGRQYLIVGQGDCGACTELISPAVTLVAGQSYYFETFFEEGGGGDYLELRWTPPSGTHGFIPSANLRFCVDPQKVPFEVTGPNDVTVEECRDATFSVSVNAPNQGPISYQWTKFGFNIDGATGPTYTLPNAQLGDDQADFQCQVSVLLRQQLSRDAILTVLPDTTPPTLIGAIGDKTLHHAILSFSEVMDSVTVGDSTFYQVCDDNGNCLTVLSATPVNGTNVVLTTFDPMTEGSNYTVTITGGPIYDRCGNPTVNPNNGNNFVAIGSTATFRAWTFVPCLLTFKTFAGPGLAIDAFVASANYPNNPRVLENGKKAAYIAGFDSRLFYPDDSHEQYNGQMEGYVVPPVTGDYIFYLRSDDPGRLYMNTNNPPLNSEDPAGAVVIADETGCCNPFSAHASPVVTLNAGQRYYVNGVWGEFGGGDYLQIAAKLAADPSNPDNLSPIGPDYVGTYVNPDTLSDAVQSLPTSGKLPLGSLSERGFDVHIAQVDVHTIANDLTVAEQMLAGTYLNTFTSTPYPNIAPVQYTVEPGFINYNIETTSYGSITPDSPFPGLPQVVGPATESLAMEAVAYVELQAGIHCMIVNSDDGFRVTPALCAADPNNSIVLGQFNGGRGTSDTPFVFNVTEAGLYPMRLIWEQGGGGANVEFVHIESGYPSRFAVNDHVKAFRPSALFKAVQVGNNLHVTWPSGAPCNATLQYATELANPSSATIWTDIAGGSPQDVPLSAGAKFFRLKRSP